MVIQLLNIMFYGLTFCRIQSTDSYFNNIIILKTINQI
jgi:hypothetical protein